MVSETLDEILRVDQLWMRMGESVPATEFDSEQSLKSGVSSETLATKGCQRNSEYCLRSTPGC